MITLGSIASALGRAFAHRAARSRAACERVQTVAETKRLKEEAQEEQRLKEMAEMLMRQSKRR